MVTSPALGGLPLTVTPGLSSTQIPVGPNGGTIVNNGTVPIQLATTDPPQGPTFTLSPGSSIPFQGGTIYGTVNGDITGTAYLLQGVQVLNSGENGIGGVGLSSEGGILSIPFQIIVAGATFEYNLGLNNVALAARLATWGYASRSVLPTSGNVTAQFGSANDAQVSPFGIYDVLPITENMSDKLQGLYIPARSPAVTISNFTDVDIDHYLNWWPA